MRWGDILAKLSRGEELSASDAIEMAKMGNSMQALTGIFGKFNPDTGVFNYSKVEFTGDVTLTKGDVEIPTAHYLRFGSATTAPLYPTTALTTGLTLGDIYIAKTSTYHQLVMCNSTTSTVRYINTTSV